MPRNLKSAVINISSTGDQTAISAVTGACIKIYGMSFTVDGATNITFKAATTAISGVYDLTGAGSSLTFEPNNDFYYFVPAGSAFTISQSGTASIQGTVWYRIGG